MGARKPLYKRVLDKIQRSGSRVFVRKDFSRITKDHRQLSRALRTLIDKGELVHFGYGVYARARVSSLSGRIVPVASVPTLGREALEKLGIDVAPTSLERAYLEGLHNQVPTGRVVGVKRRICRKIGFGGHHLRFENA